MGHLFRRWFTLIDDCPGCGLHFEREPGYWTGAMAVNITVAGGSSRSPSSPRSRSRSPNVPVVPLLAVFVPVMIVLPIAFYPFSKTIWMAFDRAVLQQLDPGQHLDEQTRKI